LPVLQYLVTLLNVCARFYLPTLVFSLKTRVSTQSAIENRQSPITLPPFFAQKRRFQPSPLTPGGPDFGS